MVTANETTFSVLGNVLIPVIATEEGQKKLKFDLEKHNTCNAIVYIKLKLWAISANVSCDTSYRCIYTSS